MVEDEKWRKLGYLDILILTMMFTGFGLLSIAAFVYFGILFIAVIGSGLIILSITLWALAAGPVISRGGL